VSQAVDEAVADWIEGNHKYDRHGVACLQQWAHGRGSRQDDVRRECHDFSNIFASTVCIADGPAIIDLHVAAIDPAELVESFPESREVGLHCRIILG
jgi:hypothetical protein